VDAKCTILGTRCLLVQASLFLTSSNHTITHTGSKEPETDHRNSLHFDKENNSFSSEQCTGSHS
jgi:hypothetical protein